MFAEVVCPNCHQRLRIPSDAEGKNAVCSVCRTVFHVADSHKPHEPSPPNPFEAPQLTQTAAIHSVSRHHAGIVLTLAILAWVLGCPVFSVIAWLMGRGDLRRMDRGRMDASGRTVTQAGTVLALVHCIVTLLGLLAVVLLAIVGTFAAFAM